MEKFFLGGILADDELDIIDHQQVRFAQGCLEFHALVAPHGGNKFDHESFGRHVDDGRGGKFLTKGVADRMHQVRLALSGRGLEIQRAEQRLVCRGRALGGI